MLKILTLNSIAAKGLNVFPTNSYEVSSDTRDPDAILVRSQNLHDFPISNSVKAIGRAGAGVNNIPVAKLTELGIPVFNTPGANANAVRELVIAGMLMASRNLCEAWHYVHQLAGSNDELHKNIEQNKKKFVGFELLGKTLGVVGLGSVGVKVANAAIALGMQVIGFDPTISVSRAWELSATVKQAHNLDDLLKHVDFITLHVPLIESTQNMINKSRLDILKDKAIILNFARQGIIDEEALIENLHQVKIRAYVTDFPTKKLQNNPNVICLPHLGASTLEAEENCAVMIAEQIRLFLENGSIKNAVNFPNVDAPLIINGTRLALVNANIPNMVAQISSVLASAGLNINGLINQSKDQVAYTLIDIKGRVKDEVLKDMAKIPGVLQVRKIPSPTPSQNEV